MAKQTKLRTATILGSRIALPPKPAVNKAPVKAVKGKAVKGKSK
jgi:hypothetical protein